MSRSDRMRFSSLALIAVLMVGRHAHAQMPQHRWWYFGTRAGADMDGATPVAMADGALTTTEGMASIADAGGELLFYTNGVQVWDRTHALMPNGDGLEGHVSASQSALIVPFPGDPQRYYLFTVPAEAGSTGGWGGLSWSEVDMAAHEGLGDVVIKNTHLVTPVTEKLTAVRHTNGRDIWVVAHGWNSDVYHAYLVTCTGIEGPVSTAIGRAMAPDEVGTFIPGIGCMQFDPQGTRLAATWSEQTLEGGSTLCTDVLRFDRSTGVFSDALAITRGGPDRSMNSYGVCFSPSGERLYVSEFGWVSGSLASQVLQYTMTVPDPAASGVVVATSLNRFYAAMQKAPDGTIYIARRDAPFLSRITQPDLAGTACNVVESALALAPVTTSTFGLPNHWDAPLPEITEGPELHDVTSCTTDEVVLDATVAGATPWTTYMWNTGATTPLLAVTTPGTYRVEIILGCDTLRDTAVVRLGGIPVDLGPDRTLCEDDSLVLVAPAAAGALYFWSDGGTDTRLTIRNGGDHGLRIVDEAGCVTGDTVQVTLTDCRCPLFVPDAFTPDGDGLNDTFAPRCDCLLRDYTLSIHDRWGREAFHSRVPGEGWDGRMQGSPAPSTVMAWTVDYAYFTGSGYAHARRSGSVTVVR